MYLEWEEIIKNLSPSTSLFKVLVYLSFKGPSQPNEVADDTGIPAGTVRPALRNLLDKGFVFQHEDGSYNTDVSFVNIISHLYSVSR